MAVDLIQELQQQLIAIQAWVVAHPRRSFYALLSQLLLLWLVGRFSKALSHHGIPRVSIPDLEKPATRTRANAKSPERPLGVWTPINFKPQAPEPYPEWDIKRTHPLPYRPFRHGPYHITMGLRTMKWDEWIELDNQYMKFQTNKARRIEERGSKCCKTAPEAFDGAVELLEEL